VTASLLAVAIVMFAFESLAARGGPLLWSFTGDARTYVDYGIPSLHGLFNAIVLLVGTLGCLMLVLRKHSRLALIALAFALAVPIFELSRQVSLSLAAQCYVLLASLSRGWRRAFLLSAVVTFSLAEFAIIGEVRTPADVFVAQSRPRETAAAAGRASPIETASGRGRLCLKSLNFGRDRASSGLVMALHVLHDADQQSGVPHAGQDRTRLGCQFTVIDHPNFSARITLGKAGKKFSFRRPLRSRHMQRRCTWISAVWRSRVHASNARLCWIRLRDLCSFEDDFLPVSP